MSPEQAVARAHGLAGDPASVVREMYVREADDVGDVLRLTHATQWSLRGGLQA
ncbi:MAG TPA: hypothetical protein VJT49_21840 [Amycolatopsis sp.]|uniref:hypothetical protein n=1 Tax=Amycolatopsis sp. TaxID=37632 RepID=UPI002B48F7E3|nr:hypothetical protein [Amycolatopsis sp.]HKS47702.1 hypothetical protein [Amycolatopsis sp.]